MLVGIIIIVFTGILTATAIFIDRKKVRTLVSIAISALSVITTAITLLPPNKTTPNIIENQTNNEQINNFINFDFSTQNISNSSIVETRNDDYCVNVSARNVEDDAFAPSIFARIGDVIEYQIEFINYSGTVENVGVRVLLPENAQYIEDSTVLYNSSHAKWAVNTNNTITTDGINIGNYSHGANAYIRLRVQITEKSIKDGTNLLYAWGQIGIGEITKQNAATVVVVKKMSRHFACS